ncbi:endonuclease/exonuclease/phosphatase family protein [Aurantimonas sp. C2-6-R+9]|uniref:endonuclease/exonuclease/phosphatase family protein n=1 Tax=unclassified Aurantimonas TaxID=2638230 RepID=UPI002E187ACB|nr:MULTISPECIES: endonuclease/exonuclease/phosphatase family protein [unclassified Aurantimonas]MEC5291755.1 endonuclease/exonuclease/phosphatase family protein [Aurantimonas sp. C2-3-R2]MEC5381888.1 endonuclease/exonuclease/phosphatase family protein [Aurantimonas sp. C2-6-R+9]MEC5412791.1 endonuclease/exonuclease/phosphatase family protein [Aurantimonas sp. C2-4-R8]
MARERFTIATFNLRNLNEPGLDMYGRDGWTADEYGEKIAFTARMFKILPSDVWAFQELWHAASLDRALADAGLSADYTALVPDAHAGGMIVCAAAVRKEILVGEPEWISRFPEGLVLSSGGDDPQTEKIFISLSSFSRPVLHFRIQPSDRATPIHVYVCHFKSKGPTRIFREPWYQRDVHSKHSGAIGGALSTIRRTAEATALRFMLTGRMKGTDEPVIVLGDINDGTLSNTMNILTGQPRFLVGESRGGGDIDLYTAQTLQEYRSTRDVYYTHIFNNNYESLDQLLVSRELYDNSRNRVWAFDGLDIVNDHLHYDPKHEQGTSDHGVVRVTFKLDPARGAETG